MTTPLFDSIFRDFLLGHDLSLVAERALLETGANGVAIVLKEEAEYVCRATAGAMTPGLGVRLHHDKGITAACIRSAQAVVCSHAESDERVNAAACELLGIASILVVPIKDRATVIGVIEALSERSHAFGAAEQAVLERIAGQIEGLTPSQFAPVHDDAMNIPDSTVLANVLKEKEEEEKPAGEGPYGDVVLDAERKRNAPLVALLVLCGFIAAALFMICARIGTRQTSVPEQPSAQFSTLPLRGVRFDEPSPALPKPRDNSVSSQRASFQPAMPRDSRDTSRGLEASARAGDASAQVRLASALANGTHGAADLVSAEAWYIVAHLAGETEAANGMRSLSRRLSNSQIAAVRKQLATMYWNGIGVKRDAIAAYSWLILAEAAGAEDVGATKQRLARELSHSQIDKARLRAQQWLRQHHQLIAQDTNH